MENFGAIGGAESNAPDAVLIAGPTASGKSDYALRMAREIGERAIIINTDSMQVYPILNILTARPGESELKQVPHYLYGHAALDQPYSVARWCADVENLFEENLPENCIPIFVGGTGLYFRALESGLHAVPSIPDTIRNAIRADLIDHGPQALHDRLKEMDPEKAAQLRPEDGQRIARALEVIMATGKPLAEFQASDSGGLLDALGFQNCLKILLMPDRVAVHDRINARADTMIEKGALDEVKALMSLNLPPESTVLKAIGVPQLRKFIYGEQSLKDSVDALKAATRQYSKRQFTWFRNQFDNNWKKISTTK